MKPLSPSKFGLAELIRIAPPAAAWPTKVAWGPRSTSMPAISKKPLAIPISSPCVAPSKNTGTPTCSLGPPVEGLPTPRMLACTYEPF